MTDVAISCAVTWETVMQPRNYDLFLWWFFEEKKAGIAKTGGNIFK